MVAARPLILTFCLAFLPLLFGIWVNYTAPDPPTKTYTTARCTRYCEAHGCPHATARNSPAFWRLRPLYVLTIKMLSAAGSAFYGAANIIFYILLVPGLLLGLTYGMLRDAAKIRQLRATHRP